jgi:hypothetical protein
MVNEAESPELCPWEAGQIAKEMSIAFSARELPARSQHNLVAPTASNHFHVAHLRRQIAASPKILP